MRLHPVSWLLLGVLAFVLMDAAIGGATYVVVWANDPNLYPGHLAGAILSHFYRHHGELALGSLAWTLGMVGWLEVLWRTLRGLRLRRSALKTEGMT
jgi:hypothetical protein